jgi:hypothetical protein
MSEVDEAQELIKTFYHRKYDELTSLQRGLALAANNFSNGTHEKEIKTLGSQIFEAAVGFAIAAIPGGFFLSKTWKTIAARRPVFAERLQFAQSTSFDAIGKVRGVSSWASENGGGQLLSVSLAAATESVNAKINRGLTALETERSAMVEHMLKLSKEKDSGILSEIRDMLGPVPPILQAHQRDLFVTILEYQLFKIYCASNVQVVKTTGYINPAQVTWDAKGLNSGQLKYIYTRFGTRISEQHMRELVHGVVKTAFEVKKMNDVVPLLRKNIETQTPLWPINTPQDIAKHWGAKLVVQTERRMGFL